MAFKEGHIPWHKGKKIDRKKYPAFGHFNKHSEESNQKNRDAHLGKELLNRRHPNKKPFTQEQIKRMLKRHRMSSLEIKFQEIVNKYNLPYKFVGNGKFFIERKNPDFINCNGEKTAVEVFYTRHKNEFRNGAENWKAERLKTFAKYGWDIKFFNEVEVNEENIIKTLGGG